MSNRDIKTIETVPAELQAAVLALNNEHAEELSWLEPEQLSALLGEAFYARRIGALEAFIMTFDQSARYDSPNFLWFRGRYPRFVYVDRVVVAAEARRTSRSRPNPSPVSRRRAPRRRPGAWARVVAADARRTSCGEMRLALEVD